MVALALAAEHHALAAVGGHGLEHPLVGVLGDSLAQVGRATRRDEPVVFLGWEPHPMNANLEMVYLEGGDDWFGPDLTGIARHAGRDRRGRVIPVGSRLNNPALQLSLFGPTGTIWQGWYFLRRPLPEGLVNAGIYLKPVEPILTTFSLLTINRDPGDKIALAGGVCITIGVLFAFFSFYRKRATGDRPEI